MQYLSNILIAFSFGALFGIANSAILGIIEKRFYQKKCKHEKLKKTEREELFKLDDFKPIVCEKYKCVNCGKEFHNEVER